MPLGFARRATPTGTATGGDEWGCSCCNWGSEVGAEGSCRVGSDLALGGGASVPVGVVGGAEG